MCVCKRYVLVCVQEKTDKVVNKGGHSREGGGMREVRQQIGEQKGGQRKCDGIWGTISSKLAKLSRQWCEICEQKLLNF